MKKHKQYHFEGQIKPQSRLGKLLAGAFAVFLLWLAIAFFTGFLLIAIVSMVLVVLCSILPGPDKSHKKNILGANNTFEQIEQDNKKIAIKK